MTKLKQVTSFPGELLTAPVNALHTLFPQPTLFHLKGKREKPLFISVLLHGNEPTGFLALQKLLIKFKDKELPRSLSFFLGNTQAASLDLRRLENQPDYNRVWPGTELEQSHESQVCDEIVTTMKRRNIFASIDVHNNTGLNPHYACINKLDKDFLQLASLFGRLVVYFTRPKGVQSDAFAKICPAVTLECGKPGQQYGVDHAFEYLNSCLHLSEFQHISIPSQDIDVFHTVAQVKINPDIDFSFANPQSNLLLDKHIEKMNFTEIPVGTSFGRIFGDIPPPLTAKDENGKIVTEQFFSIDNNHLRTKKTTMPSMLTLDERVIRQDCLCYLMEKMKL